ncbi:MAG: c-type cytochrome [Vicinamibacterales bacterium]
MTRALVALAWLVAAVFQLHGQQPVDVWSGVYTEAQAERGSIAYLRHCARCHGSDLSGNAEAEYPALEGDEFFDLWRDATLARLEERIRTGMPFDRPGTLTQTESVDLIAFLLRSNNVPPGATELPADAERLQRVVLTRDPRHR